MEEVTRLMSTGDSVKLWDAVSMAPLEQFNPHSISHPVAQACWSSNNQFMVSASSSGDKLVVSSLKSSPVPVVELAEGKKQTRVCLSSSSQFLVSGGLDHCVHIWNLKTTRLHRSLKDHKEEVTCVSFNANDSYIASGSTSGDLVLHSLTTNLSSKAFGHGSDQPIHDLRLSTLKRSLLGSVSDSGTVVLWDSNTQKELQVFDSAHKAPGSGLAFSPISELLVVSVGLDKKIVFYDTASKIVVRSIRVDNPLTSVDFTPDGTGLVVGSTRGKIYQYDLRNCNASTRITVAHKTSVTCLRFQSAASRHKSSTKISSTKRPSTKLSSSQQDPAPSPGTGPAPHRQMTAGGAGAELMSREAEGQQGAEQPPVGQNSVDVFSPAVTSSKLLSREGEGQHFVGRGSLDIFSPVREVTSLELLSREGEGQQFVGRSSLDIFSPVREDSRTQGTPGDTPFGRTQVTSLELQARDGEGQKFVGRSSLDIFSPVREDADSGANSHRKTPLLASAGRCYSPLSIFQTPPPIKEEEPIAAAAAAEPCDSRKSDKASCSSLEGQDQTTPTPPQQTNHSQPAPPFFTPEPSLRRANGIQAQLSYDSPVQGAPPTTTTDASSSSSSSSSSSLPQHMAEVAGQSAAAPLTSLQVHFIQNMIHDAVEDCRDACHRDIINLQVEMIRQFYIQLNEIHSLVEKFSVNESLVEEIERLREENRQLRTNY
ncbi:protein NEDD1 isoform X3 [Thunnus albacares]|uniref:protein NEDD1 isoform X3 n=1 Tax=Thunnus albacares TaxID=8236 RepID=UPI001CF6FAEE|nr:protein NEDD1 isoform X3 [Thunnus albacares]